MCVYAYICGTANKLALRLLSAIARWYMCMCHDSFINVTRLMYMGGMTHLHMCHYTFIRP